MISKSPKLVVKSTDHGNHTMIEPPDDLKRHALVEGSAEDISAQIAKAEESLNVLKEEFGGWMERELERLDEALAAFVAAPNSEKPGFFRAVHDVRGQAGTFGFPLAGRIADNLCRLLDAAIQVPADIVSAHVHAIRAVVRENATGANHPVGVMLAKSLERVADVLNERSAPE